jgi:hypothetical protein
MRATPAEMTDYANAAIFAYTYFTAESDVDSERAQELAVASLHTAGYSGSSSPTIVCLCGSTRFYEAFQRANYDETMAGRIVLSVGFYPHSSEQAHGETIGITPEQKQILDRLHLRKIDLADEILVLNVGGYIGESTARELAYARQLGRRVRFLEEPAS